MQTVNYVTINERAKFNLTDRSDRTRATKINQIPLTPNLHASPENTILGYFNFVFVEYLKYLMIYELSVKITRALKVTHFKSN